MIQSNKLIYLLTTLLLLILLVPCDGNAKTVKKASGKETKTTTQPAQVLEIKHWSNPDYTRIAIALERDVTWESHELDKGATRSGKLGRIFINLHNTRLGSGLRDITIGDGLLKGVRTALYKPGVVRVVLDTDNLRDYKIFPLSDPARLIIDVRGDRKTEISQLESSLSSRVMDESPAPAPRCSWQVTAAAPSAASAWTCWQWT